MVNYWSNYYRYEHQYLASSYGLLWFPAQLPVFALGIIVYFAMDSLFGVRSRMFGYTLLAMVAYLWMAFLEVRSFHGLIPPHVFYGASFTLLAVALAAHPTRLLVNSVMCNVGRISFSIYIFHFVVLYVFEMTLSHYGFALQGNWGFLVAWLLVIVTSSAVSLFTYRYVERPGIELGTFLIDRLERGHMRQPT